MSCNPMLKDLFSEAAEFNEIPAYAGITVSGQFLWRANASHGISSRRSPPPVDYAYGKKYCLVCRRYSEWVQAHSNIRYVLGNVAAS
jgi:hypothetical protein